MRDDTIQLSDLIYYKNLGIGSYGIVSLVKNKKNDYFYAIKNISTKQILCEKLMNSLELEKSILLKVDHPFIVKLVKTLKDEKNIYYLMDYLKGKELFDAIQQKVRIVKENLCEILITIVILSVYMYNTKIFK